MRAIILLFFFIDFFYVDAGFVCPTSNPCLFNFFAKNIAFQTDSDSIRTLTIDEAFTLFTEKLAVFIDARHPFLYKKAHIKDAISLYYRIADTSDLLPMIKKDQAVVIFCGGPGCDQADQLAQIMVQKGYRNVMVFPGGMDEWRAAGYPLDEEKKK